jgi:hypothetical protein
VTWLCGGACGAAALAQVADGLHRVGVLHEFGELFSATTSRTRRRARGTIQGLTATAPKVSSLSRRRSLRIAPWLLTSTLPGCRRRAHVTLLQIGPLTRRPRPAVGAGAGHTPDHPPHAPAAKRGRKTWRCEEYFRRGHRCIAGWQLPHALVLASLIEVPGRSVGATARLELTQLVNVIGIVVSFGRGQVVITRAVDESLLAVSSSMSAGSSIPTHHPLRCLSYLSAYPGEGLRCFA